MARVRRHHRLDRLGEIDVAADDPAEDVPLGQDACQPTGAIADEDRITGPGSLDRSNSIRQARAGRDGKWFAPTEEPEALVCHLRYTC